MNARHVVLLLAALCSPCGYDLAAMAQPADPPRRVNLVIFLVDDMGWMDSEPYGSQYYETPHMTRLAGLAMRFTDAYAVPLCSPTRASILTGQYTSRHGVTSATGHRPPRAETVSRYPESAPPGKRYRYAESKNYLDPKLDTLAEVLRDAGYRTGHFGKWHLGLTAPYRPDRHGFETVWHCAPDPGPPNYFSPYGVHPDGQPTARHKVGNITDGPAGEHIADRLTDEAIAFLKTHRDEPFYLNLWHYSVHGPWQHKEAYTKAFAGKTDPRGQQRNPVMASMLRNVDDSLGRILDTLDALALTEHTLFIFFSDNGGNTHSWRTGDRKLDSVKPGHPQYETVQSYRKWAGGEPPTNNHPLREGKGRIYEGGQRVPLMVRWPGHIEPGSTSDDVVGAIDLYPTVLDALGLEKPAGHVVDGISLLPVLKGTGRLDREAYFTWFPHLVPAVSVRAGAWKLIRRFEQHPEYPEVRELYNLQEDVGETTNLAAAMPAKVKALDVLIDRFIEETGALIPKPNPAYQPTAANVSARDPVAGLVPKFCRATLVDGALRIEASGRTPFLGSAQIKLKGPLRLTLRLRSALGGPGSVKWFTTDQEAFPKQGQTVPFDVAGGDAWQELTVDVPVDGMPRIVRLHLPADRAPVDVQSIRWRGPAGPAKTWDFQSIAPEAFSEAINEAPDQGAKP